MRKGSISEAGWGLCLTLAVTATSCRCGQPGITMAEGKLRLAPAKLDFGSRFVGTSTALEMAVINDGRAALPGAVQLDGPFVLDDSELVFPSGRTGIRVRFEPQVEGAAAGVLTLTQPNGSAPPLMAPLQGNALPIPHCGETVCRVTRFDLEEGACVAEMAPDGTPCTSACLPEGVCAAGECVGAVAQTCEDQNPCTIDGCAGDGGCVHQPRECPVTDACTAAYCDSSTGCATAPLADGTPCGDWTCRQAMICLAGACVTRGRPNADDECTAVDLVAAGRSTCVLTRAGTVRCWGTGYANGYQNYISAPAVIPFAGPATTLSMGESTCVSLQAGGFQCFGGPVFALGDAGAGQSGLGINNNLLGACWLSASGAVECSSSLPLPGGLTPFQGGIRSLSAGPLSFYATRDDGGVVCWGSLSQLGPHDAGSGLGMEEVPLDGPARAVRPSRWFSCAVLTDGVSCWRYSHPARLRADVVDVAQYYDGRNSPSSFVALQADGGVLECAFASDGGSAECSPRFDAGAMPAVRRAAAGQEHECFLTGRGDVACVGSNAMGQLGDLSPAPPGAHRVPVEGAALLGVSRNGWSLGVVQRDGGLLMWGAGASEPNRVPLSGVGAVELLVRSDLPVRPAEACLLRSDGGLECWDGSRAYSPFLQSISRFVDENLCAATSGAWCPFSVFSASCSASSAAPPVQRVSGAEFDETSCSLFLDGGVECEGGNRTGRLGTGSTTGPSRRVAISGLQPVGKLGMTTFSVCALEYSGAIRCWGMKTDGTVLPPTAVPGLLPGARDLACGSEHCCALLGENAVSCWGWNHWNQLGRAGGPSDIPLGVPMPDRVEQLSAGGSTTCARLRSGEVWCWGSNLEGQLGFPPRLSSSEPVWVTQ